ncbi:MAG: hypothetical protein M3438_07195 [Pseudomonadota bacterium]|nr:hypothetical protein [Pseudomonadota bacterium]
MSELASRDIQLLKKLSTGRHFKTNPGNLYLLLPGVEEAEALASFRRVLGAGLVKKVVKPEPGVWLRITDAGMARAENAIEESRTPTLKERVKSLPVGKGVWDVIKICFAFLLGILANEYLGKY